MVKDLVSIVVVNYNGEKWLKKCLEGIKKQSYKKIELIFIDNGSKDRSIKLVKKCYPKAKIVINKKNLGYAGPNNEGFRLSKGEFVLFLNNDTELTKNFLLLLLKSLKQSEHVGGVQSKILFLKDKKKIDSLGAFLTNNGFLYHYGTGKRNGLKYGKAINVYSLKGACMMFKKRVLNQVSVKGKIFDDDYFAYFEE